MNLARIESAAMAVVSARRNAMRYALDVMAGMATGDELERLDTDVQVAERNFWWACRALLADESTGPR